MEGLLYKAQVDVVFAGHVHTYERFTWVYDNKTDECWPVHITISDGGNRKGPAMDYPSPQPVISLFREVSFEHEMLEVVNVTYAHWSWHQNDDVESIVTGNV